MILIPAVLILGSLLTEKTVHATDSTVLFDAGKYISKEYRSYVSPGMALSLTEGEILKNLLRWKHSSEARIPEERNLSVAQKQLKDPVLKLVQQLFHQIPGDEVSFLPGDIPTEYPYYLTPTGIGRALNTILVALPISSADIPALKRSVLTELHPDPKLAVGPDQLVPPDLTAVEAARKKRDELGSKVGKMKEELKALECREPTADGELQIKILSLQTDINKLEKEVKTASQTTNKGDTKLLADTLVEALLTCDKEGSFYPKEFPFQILMGFALHRSKDYRQTLLELLRAMPRALSDQGNKLLGDEKEQKAMLSYTLETQTALSEIARISDGTIRPQDIIEPEHIMALSAFQRKRLKGYQGPLFNQFRTKVATDLGNVSVESTDCCEASFFNFIAMVSQEYDYKKNPVHKDLARLLETYSTPELLNSPGDAKLRSKIKQISTNIDELAYGESSKDADGKEVRHGLNPSLDNFLGLMEHLYELKPTRKQTRGERLKTLCGHFKYNGKPIRCILEPELEPNSPEQEDPLFNVKVHFKTQEKSNHIKVDRDLFTLHIDSKHCKTTFRGENDLTSSTDEMKFLSELETRYGQLPQLSPLLPPIKNASPFSKGFEPNPLAIPIIHEFGRTHGAKAISYILDRYASKDSNKDSPARDMRHKRYLLTMLNSVPLNSAEDYFLFASEILKAKLDFLYPMALEALMQVPQDVHWTYQIANLFSSLPSSLLNCEEKAKPRKLECDFKKVVSRFTDDPAVVLEALRFAQAQNISGNGDSRAYEWLLSQHPEIAAKLGEKTELILKGIRNAIVKSSERQDIGVEVQSLYNKLPKDITTQRQYHAILADRNYPFKKEELTRNGAPYSRVSHSTYGKGWKDPRGLVWLDLERYPNGVEVIATNEKAKDICLDKNSRVERSQIEDEIRRRGTPKDGCFLIRHEDFLNFRRDMGHNGKSHPLENNYIAEFLPYMSGGRKFWIYNHIDGGLPSKFDREGRVLPGQISEKASVRCVCTGEGWN